MENASKALIMAGSILIAIMVIGLLVFGYNQLSQTEQIRADAESDDKTGDYMRQFEQFNRTLYGSELLSLANLQEDYNESQTRQGLGYDRIQIEVRTNGVSNASYFTAGTFDLEEIAEKQTSIESAMAQYETSQSLYNNRSVKYYSQRSAREIAIDFGMNPPTNLANYEIEDNYLRTNSTTNRLLNDIQAYTNLTSEYNEFRTGKRFECKNVEYSNQNGRINYMYFEEI